MEEARSLLSSKAIGQAEAAFEAATRYTDAPFDALFNAGLAAFQIGASGRALERFDACVKLRPHHTSALNNRGTCLQICGRDLEAIADFDAALAKSPGYADCWYNRGISLFNLEAYEEAAESYDQALRHGAAAAKIFNNKGRALHALGRIDEAIGCYRHALELDSGYPRAHLNLAVSQLTKGNFRDGFLEFEWRKVQPEMAAGARTYPAPLWTGKEDLSGKSVLVHWEQGFGDTIQFCRYLGLLENRGAKVEFAPQKPLRDLLSSLKVKASMDALDGGNVSIHYHIPLLSLPLAFGTSLDTIPANTPYLAAEPQRVENWRRS
ncbi:MAG: tetratricopeptide repeat protein, partial [Beijerinckiaceae bacterium]